MCSVQFTQVSAAKRNLIARRCLHCKRWWVYVHSERRTYKLLQQKKHDRTGVEQSQSLFTNDGWVQCTYHATVLTVLQMMKNGAVKMEAVRTMFHTQFTPSSDMYIDVDTYPAIPHVNA
jgi:hypothetical protein